MLISRSSGGPEAAVGSGRRRRPGGLCPAWLRLTPLTSALHLRVLGSGSSGNAALVSGGGASLLVEAGLSCRDLEGRLRRAGCEPAAVEAVLVSHEHGDHSRGALRFADRNGVPILSTAGTWAALAGVAKETVVWIPIRAGEDTAVGALRVVPFRTPHDAREPVGFRIESRDEAVVLVTDFGHVSPEMEAAVEGASVLLIESNYDEQMLYESRYPFSTRERIASRFGHCSNGALALYLRRRLPLSVKTLVLAHLSANTNTPEIARATAENALRAAGRSEVEVRVAARETLTDPVRTPVRTPFPPPVVAPYPDPLPVVTRPESLPPPVVTHPDPLPPPSVPLPEPLPPPSVPLPEPLPPPSVPLPEPLPPPVVTHPDPLPHPVVTRPEPLPPPAVPRPVPLPPPVVPRPEPSLGPPRLPLSLFPSA